ncbi:hypothetical protein BGZ70_002524 [Mortierella alpina]|uniref:Phosphatidic acid phosphatase type 2/haloperoxidase domain-containing protein n=1 Tax=Mortierella alpina TaxID=64518 RepID=A0A9P6LWL9_MORAP|nr:hypothetical protein BGZ70_002524 [Mortierella alpina]
MVASSTSSEKTVRLDEEYDIEIPAGIASDAYYDSQLSPLRAALRRFLLPYIRSETPILHSMQLKVRHPILDVYFTTTAFSGNHTFFMIALPVLFWFGFSEIARGFTLIAAMGVYWAGFFKDYLCLPRPLSPPIVRLSRSKSTCLEYGFPSSHSTNAVSVALFLYCHLLTTDPASWSPYTRELSILGLIVYAVSIVYGRLYCGMHSITDCVGGSLIGLCIWAVQWTFRHTIEYYMVSPVWWVPVFVVAAGIFMVSIIPDPVDDCPCFDDCVAFIASVLRLIFGVGTLFVWRLVAKKALYVLLPPVYKLFSLPYRPHFIPASTYNTLSTYPIGKVPSVIDLPSMSGNAEIVGLQSSMDVHEKFSQAAAAQKAQEQEGLAVGLRARKGQAATHEEFTMEEKCPLLGHQHQHERDASVLSNSSTECEDDHAQQNYGHSKEGSRFEDEAEALLRVERMHPPKSRFDVDIVSKLVVYAGIGALAVDGIPILFDLVGLAASPVRV